MWVAIIVSIIVFIPCLIYAIKYYMPYREWENLIGVPLAALLVSFVVVWLTVSSMNVYLDTSDPTYEEYVIIDKDIRAGSRQATTYELEVKKDHVFTINPSDTYLVKQISPGLSICLAFTSDTPIATELIDCSNDPRFYHLFKKILQYKTAVFSGVKIKEVNR